MCSELSEMAGNIRGISEHCLTSNRERHQGIGYPGSGSEKAQHISVPTEVFLFSGIDMF